MPNIHCLEAAHGMCTRFVEFEPPVQANEESSAGSSCIGRTRSRCCCRGALLLSPESGAAVKGKKEERRRPVGTRVKVERKRSGFLSGAKQLFKIGSGEQGKNGGSSSSSSGSSGDSKGKNKS